MFENLIGQEPVKKYFSSIFRTGNVPQSMLIHGPHGTGKTAAAIEAARILTCHSEESRPCGQCSSCVKYVNFKHPDVHLFFPLPPELKDITKKTVEIQAEREKIAENPYNVLEYEKNATIPISLIKEELKSRLKYKSYQDHGRVVIILGVEKLTSEAANALLKLLEEPPDDVTFILTTSNSENVLPTIRSRCQHIQTSYVPDRIIADELVNREGISETEAVVFARLAGGNYVRARDYLGEDFSIRKDACRAIIEMSVQRPMGYAVEIAEELSAKSRTGGNHNVSVRSILELLLAIYKYVYENSYDSREKVLEEAGRIDLPVSDLIKYDHMVLSNAIEEVEKSVDLMNKNVYILVILLTLFLQLRKVFGNE